MRRRIRKAVWNSIAHEESPSPLLWWCEELTPSEREDVLCVYFERATYGRTAFNRAFRSDMAFAARLKLAARDFPMRCNSAGTLDTIRAVINAATTPDTSGPWNKRTRGCYKTLPQIARDLKLKKDDVCAWCRKLDKIARELFPVMYLRHEVTPSVRQEIRYEYQRLCNAGKFGKDATQTLATKYRLTPSQVSNLVRGLRSKPTAETTTAETVAADPDPFDF